jgi:1-acyl-sn-glycerol-3-phosphate acyltransferase
MLGPRAIAWWSLRTMAASVDVVGAEHVPPSGPVLLAARHYHHRLDAAVLIDSIPRPVHIVVGLDWIAGARLRRWMERACAAARWPVVLRPATTGASGAYVAGDVGRYLRSGLRDAAALLRDGRVLAVFPEGYPVVDRGGAAAVPGAGTPPRDAGGFLPFASGFRTIIGLARRAGSPPIAVVPVGFHYEPRGRRWHVTARFGPPLADDVEVAAVESAVRELSR